MLRYEDSYAYDMSVDYLYFVTLSTPCLATLELKVRA